MRQEWHDAWRPGMPRDVVFTIPDGAVEGAPLIVEAGNVARGAGKSIHQQNQIQTNTELVVFFHFV